MNHPLLVPSLVCLFAGSGLILATLVPAGLALLALGVVLAGFVWQADR